MFDLLVASGVSKTARREWLPGGLIAVAAHGLLVGGAVWATLEPARVARVEHSPVIVTWPEETRRHVPGPAGDQAPRPPEPVIDLSPVPPVRLPSIATGGRIEPFFPVRVVGGMGMDSASAAGPLDWCSVEEPPALLAGPPPAYPELLRAAGIEGRVVLEVVIDTLGRAEGAARVVESSNRGFEAAALAYVRGALFRPGRVRGGRAVRVLIRLPIEFSLQGAP